MENKTNNTHHRQDTHEIDGNRVLLDSLGHQFHQQHQHVVDSLVDLGAPLMYGVAGQQLETAR